MTKPTALFRCDASPQIGAGHVMRCLAFAETLAWAGWSCAFVTNRDAFSAVPLLGANGYPTHVVDENAAPPRPDAATRLVVIDHYGLDAKLEQTMAATDRTIVAFDDLADRSHRCDILVDPTPGRTPADYVDRVPAAARLLLGPCYAAVRRRWRAERHAARTRLAAGLPVEHVVVSIGATDPYDATSRVLAALAAAKIDAHIDVVLGASAPHLGRVAERIGPGITLHVDPAHLAALAAQADLAIGTAGTSSFERAVLGLPAILVPIADNQRLIASAFAAASAAEVVPLAVLDDPALLGVHIAALVADGPRRGAMSRAAASITDGRGAMRLLTAIAGMLTTTGDMRVRLRLAERKDEGWLFVLQRQPPTRRFARVPSIPTAQEHAAWFRDVLDDPDRLLAVIEADVEEPERARALECPWRAVGSLRLDKSYSNPVTLEISIAIDQHHHGQGFGGAALALARRLAPGADLVADVLPENRASLALFAAAGYRPEGRDRYRSRAA